jgi:hypothetical protein
MAQVNQRLWKIPGQRTKRKAWGFTAQINGKQVRRVQGRVDPGRRWGCCETPCSNWLPGLGSNQRLPD